MIALTDQQLDELYERSKNDRAIIVGSEVRQLIGMIRQLQNQKKALITIVARCNVTVEQAKEFRAMWEKD